MVCGLQQMCLAVETQLAHATVRREALCFCECFWAMGLLAGTKPGKGEYG